MCRLLVFAGRDETPIADMLTRPAHSIINQSFDSRLRLDLQRPLNGDGFGIGWYMPINGEVDERPASSQAGTELKRSQLQNGELSALSLERNRKRQSLQEMVKRPLVQEMTEYTHPHSPCIFVSTLPAWSNTNLIRLADKVKSKLLFAHVRAASSESHVADGLCPPPPSVSECNCHPWSYGPLMFMHNGYIANFHAIKRQLQSDLCDEFFLFVKGSTDSEHIFALFLQTILGSGDSKKHKLKRGGFSAEELRLGLTETIAKLNNYSRQYHQKKYGAASGSHPMDTSLFNFAISDGQSIVCSRYINSRSGEPASMYFSTGCAFEQSSPGVYRMAKSQRRDNLVIISSEPLTYERQDWINVQPNSTLVLDTRWFNLCIYPVQDEFWEPDVTQRKKPAKSAAVWG